jgi:ABC-type nickel/cobalt efflux system permease component RcnA
MVWGALIAGAAPAFAAKHPEPTGITLWLKQVRANETELQLSLHQALGAAGQAAAIVGLLSIAGAGYLFGAVHALLPGHGKVAIATYAFAEGRAMGGPFLLSLLVTLGQAMVALGLIYGPQLLLGHGLDHRAETLLGLERASYAGAGLAGIWLVVSGNLALTRKTERGVKREPSFVPGRGKARLPGAALPRVKGTGSLWPLVISAGLTPSAGALIMLTLAAFLGVYWAGLAALIGMALGAASVVAVFAGAADGVARAGQHVASWFGAGLGDVVDLFRVLGGFVLLALAGTLYAASYAV